MASRSSASQTPKPSVVPASVTPETLLTPRSRPPISSDLVYLTDRLIASNQPVVERPRSQAHLEPDTNSCCSREPSTIASYLEAQHGKGHFLAFSLTDNPPNDQILHIFRRQVVQLGWWSPCVERSETPSISMVLQVCYAIHAYLEMDPANVALVYCTNGKTRTAIVLACYLRFTNQVPSAREGFLDFLKHVGVNAPAETWVKLPPSLRRFFQQFDQALDSGGFENPNPTVLSAIALQGVPVQDRPMIDIWNASQEHVYSSHTASAENVLPVHHHATPQEATSSNLSHWANERGFYKVNLSLHGDFFLLCRFGGEVSAGRHDPSKILFRYSNTTGFLKGGTLYELPSSEIDLSRQYARYLENDDFQVVLLFEDDHESCDTTYPRSHHFIFRCHDPEAFEEGCKVIQKHHSVRLDKSDIAEFQKRHKSLEHCQNNSMVHLALQLANFEDSATLKLLQDLSTFSCWRALSTKTVKCRQMEEDSGAYSWPALEKENNPATSNRLSFDPNNNFKLQRQEENEETSKKNPEHSKYLKMLKMGLPIGAVKNALLRDGKDPSILDIYTEKSTEERDTGVPLRNAPEYSKYFKMLAIGLPMGAVKNALQRDGRNPEILDFDPNHSIAFQLRKKGQKAPLLDKSNMEKKQVRRKKVFWNPIDPSKIKKDSMWNIVRDSIAMDNLQYDPKEFEALFTESSNPAEKRRIKLKGDKNNKKKLVQVIDPRRSLNGGIVLAGLKTEYSKIAEYVNRMDHVKFDATQLMALKEYLPNADERRGLIAYMKKGKTSTEVHGQLYADCSETEKYMVTMIDVQGAAGKLDAMLFRTVFKLRLQEATDAIGTLNSACNEVRGSEKLRKLMAIILTVVNQINTGGEGAMVMGFTLDALLKLNEAKAFDRKTSVLHYVAKLVKKNDKELVYFDADIRSVIPAENILLDSLEGDVKAIAEELTGVHETVRAEAERLEEAGELRPLTLADLAEQRTAVHTVGGVAQFNKMDHLTGRTPMERFTVNARIACEQATESISNVRKKYATLLDYFGEDAQMASADFFGTLRRFVAEWKKAIEQVDAIERREAKEKKRTKDQTCKSRERYKDRTTAPSMKAS